MFPGQLEAPQRTSCDGALDSVTWVGVGAYIKAGLVQRDGSGD